MLPHWTDPLVPTPGATGFALAAYIGTTPRSPEARAAERNRSR